MMTQRHRLAAFLAACAVTVTVFGRALPHGFVYDDQWTLVHNAALVQAPLSAFFTDAATFAAPASGMGGTVYRPLATLSFAFQKRMGLLSPATARAVNLALHALNGLLLFLVLTTILGLAPEAAALGAGLFLLHPAQVETVAWITQRSNLMCAAAGLGALLLLARANPWGLALFILALFSKETALTLLPFLLWMLARGNGPLRQKGAMAGVLLLSAGLYLAARGAVVGELSQRAWRDGLWHNAMVGQAAWTEYLTLLAWPARLAASHWQFVDNAWEPAPWRGLALSFAWLLATLLSWRQGRRRAAAAMAWIPVTLSPHLGLVPLDTFVAERFLYLPLAGAAALAGLLWESVPKARGVLMAAVVAAGFVSFRQAGVWRDEASLWAGAVRTEPGNPFARLSLAEALYARGDFAAAAQATREGLTRNPSASLAFAGLNNLSDLSLKDNRPGAARRFAEKALRIFPNHPAALHNLARARPKEK